MAGAVESGKSTLVAILTNGARGRPILDNGRGSARMAVFRHKHEIESGRTSSLSHHMLAYDAEHRVLNYADVAPMMPSEIAAAARKVHPSQNFPLLTFSILKFCKDRIKMPYAVLSSFHSHLQIHLLGTLALSMKLKASYNASRIRQ